MSKKTIKRMLFLMLVFAVLMAQAVFAAPKLSKKTLTMVPGKTAKLKLSGASGKTVSWKSSNSKVVQITSSSKSKAVLKAKKAGKATITVVINGKKKTCKVTVKGAVKQRTLQYTGEPATDYLIELMLKEAGVKQSMTDEEIAKAIYTWMGKRFIPTNDPGVRAKIDKGYKRKRYYKSEKMTAEAQAFFRKTEAKRKQGQVVYESEFYASMFDNPEYDPYEASYLWQAREDFEYCWGDCMTHSDAFTLLCKHAGLTAGWAHGYACPGSNPSNHYWSWVVLGGKRYYVDLWQTGSNYFNNKQFSYAWFKIPKKIARKMFDFREEYEHQRDPYFSIFWF